MTAAHSTWSASKFESIMLCPGKIVLEQGLPDNTNAYAAEGTAAHQVLTWALQEDRPASAYIGRVIEVEGFTFEVDQDMAEHVQVCIDYVLDVVGDGVILVDQRVNYSSYLGVDTSEAWGTADVIVIRGDEIIVVDFKYGRGHEVDAERNPQMSLYALGALQAYQGLANDFRRVRMTISQPRIKRAASEWDCSVEELEAWGRGTARSAVVACNLATWDTPADPEVWAETHLSPSEKACKFCKAKATCPALLQEVALHVSEAPATVDEFEHISDPKTFSQPDLARSLRAVDLIEDWCKSVRAEAERRLRAGQVVPGWKLVQGKKGNRAWDKPAEVEALLKSMRLKESEMYDFKLISPASAEKLAKAGTIGPRQWPKLQSLITQPDGKAHVAPESDSRPALVVTPVADDFNDVTADFN